MKKRNTSILRSDVLYQLITSKYWNSVEEMLKKGISREKITNWLNKQGYDISKHSIGKLSLAYKEAMRDKVSIQAFIVPTSVLSVEDVKEFLKNKETMVVEYKKVKNDREILDKILQKGFNNLNEMKDSEITIPIMFQTIELKERLLSNHNSLYGDEVYQELELGKYAVIIQELIKFIPDREKSLAIQRIKDVEEQYYKDKGFFEEYKAAKQQALLTAKAGEIDG